MAISELYSWNPFQLDLHRVLGSPQSSEVYLIFFYHSATRAFQRPDTDVGQEGLAGSYSKGFLPEVCSVKFSSFMLLYLTHHMGLDEVKFTDARSWKSILWRTLPTVLEPTWRWHEIWWSAVDYEIFRRNFTAGLFVKVAFNQSTLIHLPNESDPFWNKCFWKLSILVDNLFAIKCMFACVKILLQ